ncbi:iron ABC transporter substrate-binding protein [Rhizobium sullae]|uniref:Iron ABC transporter substrate-binding protein n=1 Tax=Rhizobium sullae TaxID=50338 RepID=A0A2N0CZD4_RHISU|nr:ABC transporter substrate-binding protein [Rhizobium sullae]PKA39187.1 iron ABC transporter substrate-binding protein [Rhizobium sullae]
MKRNIHLTTAAIVLSLFKPAIANDLNELSAGELLEKAKAEGKVTVYSFTSRVARLEKAFEAAYPEIDLQGYDISSTEQISRLKAEAGAGIANADVVYISDAPVVLNELVVSGILENYVPPRVADRLSPEDKAPLLAQRLSTKVLMYNEEANPNGSPIKNLWQLTTPEWKGRVVMVDPLQRGDYLDLMTEIVLRSGAMAKAYEAEFGKPIELGNAEDAGHKFISDLFANDLILVKSTDDVNAAVGKLGQRNPPVGFTSYSDRRDNKDEGWALQVSNATVPASGIVFPVILGIAKGSQHPAAARLAIDFFMGDESKTGGEAFKPFYVPGDYATRTDIAPHPDAVPLDKLTAWHMDPTATAKARKDVGDFILTLQ